MELEQDTWLVPMFDAENMRVRLDLLMQGQAVEHAMLNIDPDKVGLCGGEHLRRRISTQLRTLGIPSHSRPLPW